MVIRRIDDLGRLQLPKDYRKTLDIHEGDELVIGLADGYISVKKEEKKIGEEGMAKVLDRLAAYEDTGLTPEEVQKIATAKAEGRLIIRPFTWDEIRKQIG